MVFDDETTFKDGIYGLYKRRGLDPDRLQRSVAEEFHQNSGGKWLREFQYVVEKPAQPEYPSSKGEAPSQAELPAYVRDLGHAGFSLEDFHKRQPGLGTKNELTLAEVAVLRLYTGPVFKPWNEWLRYGRQLDDGESVADAAPIELTKVTSSKGMVSTDDWSTSLAVLYNAIIKLSALAYPGMVYRGVKEDKVRLPDLFIPRGEASSVDGVRGAGCEMPVDGTRSGFAGGVEKAFMSTSRDPAAALRYSGSIQQAGSILQITFDIGSRGADVQWVSQFPAEQELLYPPCTSLTCSSVMQIGCKRVLNVTASVSTHRPEVSWCHTPMDKPPSNRPQRPESLGPFALTQLDVQLYHCELVDKMRRRLAVRSSANDHAREKKKRAAWMVEGMRFSPMQAVSLGADEREGALIPLDATHYAFAYPLEDEDQLQQIEDIVEPTLRALTTVGGFAYFNAEGNSLELLSLNVLVKSDGRGLTFSGPVTFDNEPTVPRPPISEQSAVTLPQLMKCGIQKFSWMPQAGEHGAFGYFYADPAMDCFYTVSGVQSGDTSRFFKVEPSAMRKLRRTLTKVKAQLLPSSNRNKVKLSRGMVDLARGTFALDVVRPRAEAEG